MQPPGVCAYLIMYNRFHNYVAEQLLAINENARFSLPKNYASLDREKQEIADKKQDEDLFQTARLSVQQHAYLFTQGANIHLQRHHWSLYQHFNT